MKLRIDVVPYLDDLWRYARVLTKNSDLADEIVQESLIRALSLAHTYDDARPLLPWLIRIVRNTHLTGLAKRAAEERRTAEFATLCGNAQHPSQEHSADLNSVQKAMKALPVEQAEVLHLVGVLGFSYGDASAVLDIPMGTLMSRLSRARAALKASLEGPIRSGVSLRVVGGGR
ncbi:MAG: sigma-70 family RNA polymerase sigma factor [Rhizobiaceae bacterium]